MQIFGSDGFVVECFAGLVRGLHVAPTSVNVLLLLLVVVVIFVVIFVVVVVVLDVEMLLGTRSRVSNVAEISPARSNQRPYFHCCSQRRTLVLVVVAAVVDLCYRVIIHDNGSSS